MIICKCKNCGIDFTCNGKDPFTNHKCRGKCYCIKCWYDDLKKGTNPQFDKPCNIDDFYFRETPSWYPLTTAEEVIFNYANDNLIPELANILISKKL